LLTAYNSKSTDLSHSMLMYWVVLLYYSTFVVKYKICYSEVSLSLVIQQHYPWLLIPRYVVSAGTEFGRMKMVCVQLVARHIQRIRQISSHSLRRKWLVWRLKRGTRTSKESRRLQRTENILPTSELYNEILFSLLGFPWGWQMQRLVAHYASGIRVFLLYFPSNCF